MSFYVTRDGSNDINGLFRWPVPELDTQEQLPDDHPEVVAFLEPEPEVERVERRIMSDPVLRRLVGVMADDSGRTVRQVLDAIRTKP